MEPTTSPASKPDPDDLTEDDRDLLTCIRARFDSTAGEPRPIFVTDAGNLWDRFRSSLPEALQRVYDCGACRLFVERFGALVVVGENGATRSVLWSNEAPGVFQPGVAALRAAVERAPITGVFLSKDSTWGKPETGPWQHFAVTPPPAIVHRDVLRTAGQRMAELREEYGTLRRGLAEFRADVVRNAHHLLTSGHLYRSEKCIGVAEWLVDLHEKLNAAKDRRLNENLAWVAVATAPPGFCHVRSTMIGTLLEDLVAGMPFHEVKRRFDQKMHPLQYQRPSSEPGSENIEQAEKIVERLGIASALKRRFARVEEVDAIWRPSAGTVNAPAKSAGVFGHLRDKVRPERAGLEAPPVVITWEKFSRTVLPAAETIELLVPHAMASYIGIVTAADPDAPPLIQWDRPDRRNPFSWYVYPKGSRPEDWNLTPGAYVRVTSLTLLPPQWYGGGHAHQGEGVLVLLQGARDLRYQSGAGFFPEQLRSELHAVRKTLEAFAKRDVVAGAPEATACGRDLRKGAAWDATLRVKSNAGRATYRLDRWD
jgi:hypothetical protein